MQRRRFLRATAATVPTFLAGCSIRSGRPGTPVDVSETDRSTHTAGNESRTTGSRAPARRKGGERTDFCWLERSLWEDRAARENLLAFARRHGFAVLLAHSDSTDEPVSPLDEVLQTAVESDVEAWLNVGVLTDLTPEEFVTDPEKRASHLAGLRAITRAYRARFPQGRIVLWQEAPVGGTWVEGGAWNERAVSNLERYGPAIFAAQKRVVSEAAPDVDVGIFVHFPYVVPSRQPETFATVVDELKRRGEPPDFAFVDFYRGWYEKDVGPEKANDAIRGLVDNAKKHLSEVLYLGQSHTIDPHHTPSRKAIRMDLRASAAANGRGWYARTAYTETRRGFDPFVPNVGRVRDADRVSTVTVARDRYLYAYTSLLSARADFDAGETFDCWVRTRNVGFYERRLSLLTAEGDWEFVGHLGGYVPDVPYSSADHVSIVHALDRDRFLTDGTLTGRLEPASDTDSTGDSTVPPELVSVSVVPFDVGAYVPEYEARTLLDAPNFERSRLGHAAVGARLDSGGAYEFRVPIDRPTAPGLFSLLFPEHEPQRRRLAAFESRDGFDFEDVFDCWLTIDGPVENSVDDLFVSTPSDRGHSTGRAFLADASVARSSTRGCAVFYGLDRRLLPRADDDSLTVGIDRAGREGLTVERAYVMPYFGSDDLVTATRARSLIAADPDEVETFAVARASPKSID